MLSFSINRYQAFSVHLLISALIVGVAAGVVFLIWYPGLLAYASGVAAVFFIMAAVDVVLGPCITLLIFNTQKKELKRDLLIVLLVQVAALLYGLWVMFFARPIFVVFNADRFDVVYANEISQHKYLGIKSGDYNSPSIWGPKFVGARLPDDAQKAMSIIKHALAGGDDIQHMPNFYMPYIDMREDVIGRIRPLEELRKYNQKKRREVDALLNQYSSTTDNFGYLPLKAKVHDITVIVDRETASVVEMNKLSPVDNSFGVNSLDLKKILKK